MSGSVIHQFKPYDPMNIRPMTPLDLPAVLAIEQQQLFPWSEAQLKDFLTFSYECRVLEEGTQIIGFAIMKVVVDEAEILNIAIDEAHQGVGHGRFLLRAMLALAKEQRAETAYLEVRVSNAKALGLYEKLGFTPTGSRKGYYRAVNGTEDAILMRCVL